MGYFEEFGREVDVAVVLLPLLAMLKQSEVGLGARQPTV